MAEVQDNFDEFDDFGDDDDDDEAMPKYHEQVIVSIGYRLRTNQTLQWKKVK